MAAPDGVEGGHAAPEDLHPNGAPVEEEQAGEAAKANPAQAEEEEEQEIRPEDVQIEEGRAALVALGLEKPPQHIIAQGASVTYLDLTANNVTTTEWLSAFPNLRTLVLDNNSIATLHASFPKSPHLHTIWMNKNNVSDLEEVLAALNGKVPKLQYFSLLGNPACPNALMGATPEQYKRYRLRTLYCLGLNLKFLDTQPVTKNERQEASTQGQYLKIAKAPVKQQEIRNQGGEREYYKPDEAREGRHTSYYGYTRHMYSGKSSEGNRFIVDGHL